MPTALALIFSLGSLLSGGAPGPAEAVSPQDTSRWPIRQVAVSATHVVFSYAGDLWRVDRAGGAAVRLTESPAEDDFPVFSPDGLNIAFSRRGADDWDVYLIGLQGGEAQRLTYHPEADITRGWSADGSRILFLSHRDEEYTFRLYTIASGGGFPRALPLPRAWDGSYGPQGERLAYVPVAWPIELGDVDWRHYRGGMSSRIRLVNLGDLGIERIPGDSANDRRPMWLGQFVYFISDRSGSFNLHRYDTQTRRIGQLTDYSDYGIEAASAGGGAIAFVQAGQIRLFDVGAGSVSTLQFEITPERGELEPRTVDGAQWIQSAATTPAADRIFFGVRGDVVVFDVTAGTAENLTRSAGVAERDPVPSPDGRWLAYFSDETGEYELQVRPLSGSGTVKKIPVELRSSFYRELAWSPDSKRLAFSDKRLTLWVADIETGGARRVTTSDYSDQDRYQPAWSPDGRWLAYSLYEPNRLRTIYLYDAERGRRFRVSGGRVHAEHPVFDRSGNYLYFVASNTAPLGDFGWSVLSSLFWRPLVSRTLHVAILRPGLPAPVYPIIGDPNPAKDSILPGAPRQRPGARRPSPSRRGEPPAGGPGMRQRAGGLDLEGVEDRIIPLPLPAKDYAGLAAAGPGQLYVLTSEWPAAPLAGNSPTTALYRYDLDTPKSLEKLIDGVDEVSVSGDGRKILYRQGRDWMLVPGDQPPEPQSGRLDLGAIQIEIDPSAEWRQIYRESWRLMRDYFYDPSYHGYDLAKLQDHFATYLPNIARRADLNRLLGRALGHLSVSHLQVRGGDLGQVEESPSRIGLLGADYEVVQNRYRITRIYRSGHFNAGHPLLRAPLDQPGIVVSEGDYLISVAGERVSGSRNIYSYFEGTALKPVEITVASQPDGGGSRTYVVVPLPGENTLRRMNWAERNRQIVEEETQGVLGYIWVPNFGRWGVETVIRQLLESSDRRGLIIDQRFAGGGITADGLIEMLGRHPLYYYLFRHGDPLGVPANAVPAAKVLLINDTNGSAAETFALMFKLGKLGKTIGSRTAGAGIGPLGAFPELIDGGRVVIPNRAAFDPAGRWAIENQGIEPDIAVEWLPRDWRAGSDPQLQAAINTALQAIVDNPVREIKPPEFPIHRR